MMDDAATLSRISERAMSDADLYVEEIADRYPLANPYVAELFREGLETRNALIEGRLPGIADVQWGRLSKELDIPLSIAHRPTVFAYVDVLQSTIRRELLIIVNQTLEDFGNV